MSDVDDILAVKKERARQAKELLDHPLMQEAMASVERGFIAQWLATGPDEAVKREHLWIAAKTCNAVPAFLQQEIETAAIAAAESPQQ